VRAVGGGWWEGPAPGKWLVVFGGLSRTLVPSTILVLHAIGRISFFLSFSSKIIWESHHDVVTQTMTKRDRDGAIRPSSDSTGVIFPKQTYVSMHRDRCDASGICPRAGQGFYESPVEARASA